PRIVEPQVEPEILSMTLPLNPAWVVARDPEGRELVARWIVPGYRGELETSVQPDGEFTIFTLFLPRLPELDGQTVSVLVFDTDPDDPQATRFDFTVEVP
ncbi:MAG: hypothetical protein AAGA48_14130, partial [Myxococcota bacterium]